MTKITKSLRHPISGARYELVAFRIRATILHTRRCDWCEKHLQFGRSFTGYIYIYSLRTYWVTVYLCSSICYRQQNSDLTRVERSVESCSCNAYQRSNIRGNDSSPRSEQLAGQSQLSPPHSRHSRSLQLLGTRQIKMVPIDSTATVEICDDPHIPGHDFNMVWNKGMFYLSCFSNRGANSELPQVWYLHHTVACTSMYGSQGYESDVQVLLKRLWKWLETSFPISFH